MAGEDVERRIEEELRRRERAAREPPAPEPAGPPTAPERRDEPGAGPAPQGPDVEALFRRLRGEIDAMEGRMTAGIDAAAKRLAPVPQAAAELRNWVRGAKARGEAVNRLASLMEENLDRESRIHRPARRSARAVLFALALAVAILASLGAQWQFAVLGTADPSRGWRDHLWDRYGAELRDCAVRADREGKAMLCTVFDPEPILP